MGVRKEAVELSLIDNGFSTGMAKDAALVALLNRELHNLDGTSVRTNRSTSALGSPGGGIDKTGSAARRGSADLNQFTGRLNLLATVAATVGPALLPIGAVAVPAVTSLIGGLGATVGAVGTAVLAFHGLGDALKALDAYQLDPTAEHLKKVQETLGQMSPAAQDFVMRLDELEPVLGRLQHIAQRNMFPGLSEGLDESLALIPVVQQVVRDLSRELGTLAADTGKALSNDGDWQAFFDFIRTDAAPTLDAFARATGNLVAGLGSILVAFRPLSDDFSSGLLDMSRSFREWAANLDDNAGFQEFVSYIRENGPAVEGFFVAAARAIAALAEAAAPWGSAVLPALTAVADVFATIAGSPIGPVLFTAAAGMLAINRTAGGLNKVATSLGAIGIQAPKVKTGLMGIAGVAGGILAAGTAVGALADGIGRIHAQDLDRALESLSLGNNPTKDLRQVVEDIGDITSKWNSIDLGEIATAGGLFGDTSLDKMADNIDQVDQALASMVESGNGDEAAQIMSRIVELAGEQGTGAERVASQFDSYQTALDNAADALGPAANALGGVGDAAGGAADAVGQLTDAVGSLNGWLDKRGSLRNYEQSLDDFTQSLKDNGRSFDITTQKGRDNQAALDGVARSIADVADKIHNPGRRESFIKSAISDLRGKLPEASDEGKAAIRRVIGELKTLAAARANPRVNAQTAPAIAGINAVESRLAALNGKSATVTSYFKTIYTSVGKPTSKTDPTLGGLIPKGHGADGARVPKTGLPYADRHLYMLADGERVTSNRHGQADKADKALTLINSGLLNDSILGLADGGTAGRNTRRSIRIAESYGLEIDKGDGLKKRLRLFGKALDEAKKALDNETSARDSLVSSITSNLTSNLFGQSQSGSVFGQKFAPGSIGAVNATLQRDIDNAKLQATLTAQLRSRGVTGPALQDLVTNGGLSALQSFANASNADLANFQTLYGTRSTAVATAAGAGANALGMTAEVGKTTAEVRALHHTVKHLEAVIKANHADSKKDRAANTHAQSQALNGAAANGHRHRKRGGR